MSPAVEQAGRRRQLVIVQPYIPAYRVPFFDRLVARLATLAIDVRVAAPDPTGDQAQRRDAVDDLSYHVRTRQRQIPGPGGVRLVYHGSWGLVRSADLAIVPAAASCLDSQLALFGPGRSRRGVALWGHIDAYVKAASKIDRALERAMMRRADHVLAYTDRGRDFAVQAGLPPSRVTAVQNAIDTEVLTNAFAAVTPRDEAAFREQWGLRGERVFGYVGGLDADKRIDFLVSVMDDLYERVGCSIQFVFAGRGVDERLLAPSIARGQSVHLGFADARTKALIARVSLAFVNPGRIGLVAVDALTLGRPILTSDFAHHAPEADYLDRDTDVHVVPGTAKDFSAFLNSFEGHNTVSPPPSLSAMIDRFTEAVTLLADSAAGTTRGPTRAPG